MPINTHDLHTEVDRPETPKRVLSGHFNSRPPHGGRLICTLYVAFKASTSTHDLHTEVDKCPRSRREGNRTSTHDLHTEVDFLALQMMSCPNTSTHDLHTEVDFCPFSPSSSLLTLQLTTSTRRSTRSPRRTRTTGRDFNSRPPHGGRLLLTDWQKFVVVLQLTTSTRRSTAEGSKTITLTIALQLTTSTRRSTVMPSLWIAAAALQLTTSTRRSTLVGVAPSCVLTYFNSRPPHGGRQFPNTTLNFAGALQLTTSTRRSTSAHGKFSV